MQMQLNPPSLEIWSMRSQVAGLLLYGPLFEAGPGRCFVRLLDAMLVALDEGQTGDLRAERRSRLRLQQAYGNWFGAIGCCGRLAGHKRRWGNGLRGDRLRTCP
jgi:hypothetical protein